MTDAILVIDRSDIVKGRRQLVEQGFRELVQFVKANEARTIFYNVYLNPDGTEVTVVQVHPDSASMEYHMQLAGPMFAKFKDLLRLKEMHVYGRPSETLLQLLRQKAALLGADSLLVHGSHAGFAHFGGG